jgi:hypothetical protein
MTKLQAGTNTTARRGRRHLDGQAPGEGEYMRVVALSLRPEDIAALEAFGGGNRSLAVRRLLALAREHEAGGLATAA